MKKKANMKVYKVYIDDSKSVFMVLIPAFDEQSAAAYCEGNGQIIAIKEYEEFERISEHAIGNALSAYGFTQEQSDIILRALYQFGITV